MSEIILNPYQLECLVRYQSTGTFDDDLVAIEWLNAGPEGPGLYCWSPEYPDDDKEFLPEVSPNVIALEEKVGRERPDATDFGAELQRQIDASPELAEAVFEASVEIDRESVRYKELKKRVLEWLREKRDEDGSGCCYGLKTIADAMKCTMGELVDWDNDYGVLFDLGREGNISWTAGQDCVYAVGGRTTWDEF